VHAVFARAELHRGLLQRLGPRMELADEPSNSAAAHRTLPFSAILRVALPGLVAVSVALPTKIDNMFEIGWGWDARRGTLDLTPAAVVFPSAAGVSYSDDSISSISGNFRIAMIVHCDKECGRAAFGGLAGRR